MQATAESLRNHLGSLLAVLGVPWEFKMMSFRVAAEPTWTRTTYYYD